MKEGLDIWKTSIFEVKSTYPSLDVVWTFLHKNTIPTTSHGRVDGGDMILTRWDGGSNSSCLVLFRALSRGSKDTAGNSRGLGHEY